MAPIISNIWSGTKFIVSRSKSNIEKATSDATDWSLHKVRPTLKLKHQFKDWGEAQIDQFRSTKIENPQLREISLIRKPNPETNKLEKYARIVVDHPKKGDNPARTDIGYVRVHRKDFNWGKNNKLTVTNNYLTTAIKRVEEQAKTPEGLGETNLDLYNLIFRAGMPKGIPEKYINEYNLAAPISHEKDVVLVQLTKDGADKALPSAPGKVTPAQIVLSGEKAKIQKALSPIETIFRSALGYKTKTHQELANLLDESQEALSLEAIDKAQKYIKDAKKELNSQVNTIKKGGKALDITIEEGGYEGVKNRIKDVDTELATVFGEDSIAKRMEQTLKIRNGQLDELETYLKALDAHETLLNIKRDLHPIDLSIENALNDKEATLETLEQVFNEHAEVKEGLSLKTIDVAQKYIKDVLEKQASLRASIYNGGKAGDITIKEGGYNAVINRMKTVDKDCLKTFGEVNPAERMKQTIAEYDEQLDDLDMYQLELNDYAKKLRAAKNGHPDTKVKLQEKNQKDLLAFRQENKALRTELEKNVSAARLKKTIKQAKKFRADYSSLVQESLHQKNYKSVSEAILNKIKEQKTSFKQAIEECEKLTALKDKAIDFTKKYTDTDNSEVNATIKKITEQANNYEIIIDKFNQEYENIKSLKNDVKLIRDEQFEKNSVLELLPKPGFWQDKRNRFNAWYNSGLTQEASAREEAQKLLKLNKPVTPADGASFDELTKPYLGNNPFLGEKPFLVTPPSTSGDGWEAFK